MCILLGSLRHPVVYDPAACVFVPQNKHWMFGACTLWMLSSSINFRVPPSTLWSICLPQPPFFRKKLFLGACILWISMFINFSPSKHPTVYVSVAYAFFVLKIHAPGVWEHVSPGFCISPPFRVGLLEFK